MVDIRVQHLLFEEVFTRRCVIELLKMKFVARQAHADNRSTARFAHLPHWQYPNSVTDRSAQVQYSSREYPPPYLSSLTFGRLVASLIE
jgi:hypothetical protein